MHMHSMKIYKVLLVIALIGVTGIIFFFYHFGHHDSVALMDFSIAYTNYDMAIANYTTAIFASNRKGTTSTDTLEDKTDQALVELNLKASARISSLTRNDAKIMSITEEIASLSRKELDVLKAYRSAIANKDADLDKLAKELDDLMIRRQAAYARFQELKGL